MFRPVLILCFSVTIVLSLAAGAKAETKSSPGLMGALGLNTVFNARHDKTGTVRAGASTLDPYLHGLLSIQIAPRLQIGLRQTALVSDINDAADRLFPGIDLKLKLLEERQYIPAVSLGLQSAIGHKQMAGEYLAFSKRFREFDFTAGMAWGRLGSAAHMKNPLGVFGDHFDKPRAPGGEAPNKPEDWFTGEDIGFFGGLEYHTPLSGLSVKADWGADRYIIEKTAFDYDPPDPWALGMHYSPVDWAGLGVAIIGGEKLMGHLSFQNPLSALPLKNREEKAKPLRPYRTGLALPGEMETAARMENIQLHSARRDTRQAWAMLDLPEDADTPKQIGRAARHMANHGGEHIEALHITPARYGLHGPTVRLIRRDLEMALVHLQGSAEEIWSNTEIREKPPGTLADDHPFQDHRLPLGHIDSFSLTLDNELSLSEEDNGLLYRTALLIGHKQKLSNRLMAGTEVRVDITDNLYRLREFRPAGPLPVRSNADQFAERTLSIDRAYFGYLKTLKPDLHMALSIGVLEEMYSGIGGALLYRPFGKTFAFGVEAFQAFKRDPSAPLNLGLNGDHILTGHVNGYYEFPETGLTLKASAGRYLAEDIGGSLALQKRFGNDLTVEAFMTATDRADPDLFGSTTHLYSGLKFRIPIGKVHKYIPRGSAVTFKAAQIGRDSGQRLDNPLPLYDLTEPFSYRHLTQNWTSILD